MTLGDHHVFAPVPERKGIEPSQPTAFKALHKPAWQSPRLRTGALLRLVEGHAAKPQKPWRGHGFVPKPTGNEWRRTRKNHKPCSHPILCALALTRESRAGKEALGLTVHSGPCQMEYYPPSTSPLQSQLWSGQSSRKVHLPSCTETPVGKEKE